jgi:hypothetical protein
VLAGTSAIASLDAGLALAATFTTTQLTNNSFDDIDPQISSLNAVWQGGDLSDAEIFFYNGKSNLNPQISS